MCRIFFWSTLNVYGIEIFDVYAYAYVVDFFSNTRTSLWLSKQKYVKSWKLD